MKNIDDKKIIDTIKNDTNYQIKTSSADILRQYRSEISEPVKEKHTKRNFLVFGGLGATLVATAAILLVVFSNNNPSEGGNGGSLLPNATIKNSSFQEQLVAFSAFTHATEDNKLNNLKSLKYSKGNEIKDEDEDNEKEQQITKEYFEDICYTFNNINYSIAELNKETEFKGVEFNQEINGKKYKYVNEIYFKGEKDPFAKMYFNDEKLVTEEEGEQEYEALYLAEDEYYDLKIEKEIETDKDEQEIEYQLKFKSQSRDHSYKIKKENEFEGVESESCYSYTTYNDRNFKKVDYSITYKSEVEVDKQKIEVQLTKDNKEYLFEDIIETSEEIKFKAELESPIGEKVVDGIEILGTKGQTTITYVYEDLTYTI